MMRHIRTSVRQDGFGGTHDVQQRVGKEKTDDQNPQAEDEGGNKAGRGHLGGILKVVRTQLAGDVVARAVSTEEAERLNHCHQRENDANGGGGAGVDFADKKGVRHVVKGCDQHTDDGRDCQLANQSGNRGLGHTVKFLLSLFFCTHMCSSSVYS